MNEFEGYKNGFELLSRYNVAQCQVVLYDAISMTVWAKDDFKTILRYAKLARLMHAIVRLPDGTYSFHFDGPSTVLRQSRRYGVALAKFLPALIACREWKMQARIRHRRLNWENLFRLSSANRLSTTHPGASDFDSSLEEKFANQWGIEPREGWTMSREAEIFHDQQKTFIPDFVFTHSCGLRVAMEVVGFWTPEYLTAKVETLTRFKAQQVLLAVADQLDWPPDLTRDDTIRFKTSILPKHVLEHLQRRLENP